MGEHLAAPGRHLLATGGLAELGRISGRQMASHPLGTNQVRLE